MRLALQNALSDNPKYTLRTVTAYESNDVCNTCYAHNLEGVNSLGLGESRIIRKNIEQLKEADLLTSNVWTMSPPCQPFTKTKGSLEKGSEDARSKAFSNLMSILRSMSNPPKFIFLENVAPFNTSPVHTEFTSILKSRGYTYKEFELSPMHFSVPNNRTRFYISAERTDGEGHRIGELITEPENPPPPYIDSNPVPKEDYNNYVPICQASPLSQYILPDSTLQLLYPDLSALIIPPSTLSKPFFKGMSIVGSSDCVTFCFTSSYGKTMHKSSGSLFARHVLSYKDINKSDDMSIEYQNAIRFFAPEELLKIFGFPETFEYQSEISLKRKYKLIGQSVNIKVVEYIMNSILNK